MEDWKQAYSLALFELKHSKINFLYLLLILAFVLFLVVPSFPEYFANSSMGLDIAFILTFTIVSQWARPKLFRSQKLSGGRYACHYLITLNQLPIKKEIIVKYRFLTYIMTSIPFQLLFLLFLYILTPSLHAKMTISSYLVFSVIWFCFSFYLGSSNIHSEAGSNLYVNIAVSIIIAPFLLVLFTFLFYKSLFQDGFVGWTIFIAQHYPILSIITSLILAIIGSVFWMKRMVRRMETYDYFI